MKENCLWGRCKKKVKKINNSAFSATHTYIKLTLVSFFLLFFHAPSPDSSAVLFFTLFPAMRPDLMRTTCLCRFMATGMVDRLNSGEPPGFRENMLNLFHPHVPMEVEDIERNSCVRIMHLALQTPGDRDVQAWILRTLLHQVLWRQVLLEALHRQGPCWPPTEKELQV